MKFSTTVGLPLAVLLPLTNAAAVDRSLLTKRANCSDSLAKIFENISSISEPLCALVGSLGSTAGTVEQEFSDACACLSSSGATQTIAAATASADIASAISSIVSYASSVSSSSKATITTSAVGKVSSIGLAVNTKTKSSKTTASSIKSSGTTQAGCTQAASSHVKAKSSSTKTKSSSTKAKSSGTAKATSASSTSVAAGSSGIYSNSTSIVGTGAAVTGAPSATVGSSATVSIAASCTVTDVAALAAATSACTALMIKDVTVPASTTLDMSKLNSGTTVVFSGTTTFEYAAKDYDMIKIGGTDIEVYGETGAIIDGNGNAWWDGEGSNGGTTKPDHFFVISKALGSSSFHDLYIQNWPTHCFDVTGSDGVEMYNIVLNNTAGDASNSASGSKPAAHNSDGFDLSSTNNAYLHDVQVYNQDDCVAVTSGTNVTIDNFYCSGGHGLSIGSIGGKSNNVVDTVTFSNSKVVNSENGVRIKTNSGTTGTVKNIVYENISMSGISKYGLDIQQDYLNGGPTGTPTNGVTISGITMTNVTGTVSSKAKDYYILCGSDSCSSFTFNSISITGGTGDSCNLTPTGDFTC